MNTSTRSLLRHTTGTALVALLLATGTGCADNPAEAPGMREVGTDVSDVAGLRQAALHEGQCKLHFVKIRRSRLSPQERLCKNHVAAADPAHVRSR